MYILNKIDGILKWQHLLDEVFQPWLYFSRSTVPQTVQGPIYAKTHKIHLRVIHKTAEGIVRLPVPVNRAKQTELVTCGRGREMINMVPGWQSARIAKKRERHGAESSSTTKASPLRWSLVGRYSLSMQESLGSVPSPA